ncbi:MAG: TetR/AcrR family transcriptional regulator [Acidobacteriota bacterium]
MDVFWQQGFQRTSMSDLEAATDVLRGSLYWTFGDKHSLFVHALNHYRQIARDVIEEHLEPEAPTLETLRHALLGVVTECSGPDAAKGCLMGNSAVELTARDPEIRAVVRQHYLWMETRFAEVLRAAIDAGEVAAERDPQALGRLLVVSIQGLKVLGKTGPTRGELEDVVDEILRGLGLSGDPSGG